MALDSTMELLHALAVTDSSNDMYRKRVITNASKDFTKKHSFTFLFFIFIIIDDRLYNQFQFSWFILAIEEMIIHFDN